MKLHARTFMMVTLGLAAFVATKASAQKVVPATPDGVEVLARGPVHEASQRRPRHGRCPRRRTEKPPDPIEEVPPDEKPAGDHVLWIPAVSGMGRRTKRLPVGERLVACAAAGPTVDTR